MAALIRDRHKLGRSPLRADALFRGDECKRLRLGSFAGSVLI
jgi:hypothetical protein